MTIEDSAEHADWREKASKSPDYYLDTEVGRQELMAMIRAEADRLLLELRAKGKPSREIIWFSSHCRNCRFCETAKRGDNARCMKWKCRLVRPFYGRPVWVEVAGQTGDSKLAVRDIIWGERAADVTDLVVEAAMEGINSGFPYPCFEPSR